MGNRKYNASGMGETMKLNDAQLYNGPVERGGAQEDAPNFGPKNNVHPGHMGEGMRVRDTPPSPQGVRGVVAPASKQPDGSVSST
jgi:hypothetical protein